MIQVTSSEKTNLPTEDRDASFSLTKKKWGKKEKIIGVIVVAIFFYVFFIIDSGGDKESKLKIITLSTGKEGIINNNTNPNDCSGKTIVGVTKEDIKASIKAQVVNDKEGYLELAGSGRIFSVENCTPIRKIDSSGTLGSLAKVRFLGGTHYSPTGWIPYEFAIQK